MNSKGKWKGTRKNASGGAYRSAFSRAFEGRTYSTKEEKRQQMKEANEEAHRLIISGEWQDIHKEGRDATFSYRAGGTSFGRNKRRKGVQDLGPPPARRGPADRPAMGGKQSSQF